MFEDGGLSASGRISATDTQPTSSAVSSKHWQNLGFENIAECEGAARGVLPAKVVAIKPSAPEARDLTIRFMADRGVPPSIVFKQSDGDTFLYRLLTDQEGVALAATLPAGIRLFTAGDTISLPAIDATMIAGWPHLSQIAVLPIAPSLDPIAAADSLLRKFSLRGRAAELEASAQATSPLLGDVCLSGQTTIWYAPPNAGKTLCALRFTHDAITEKRIAAGDVYYFNADDNSAGLAQKLRIMDDLGAHTIAPGFNGFKNRDLLDHIKETASRDEARGTLVIIDTVKKFTSLMDKRQSSEFADACRQYALRGGTVLGLAHTAKNANPDGKLRYAGTTDLLEDFDAAYMLSPLDSAGQPGDKVVEFQALKRRGDSAETAFYSYSAEQGLSYEERLLSVEPVDPATIDDFKRVATAADDAPVIDAIKGLISEGVVQKMLLAKEAAARTGVSQRASIKVLEAYTGTDPATAHWAFAVKERGAKVFALLQSNVQEPGF